MLALRLQAYTEVILGKAPIVDAWSGQCEGKGIYPKTYSSASYEKDKAIYLLTLWEGDVAFIFYILFDSFKPPLLVAKAS